MKRITSLALVATACSGASLTLLQRAKLALDPTVTGSLNRAEYEDYHAKLRRDQDQQRVTQEAVDSAWANSEASQATLQVVQEAKSQLRKWDREPAHDSIPPSNIPAAPVAKSEAPANKAE